MGLVPAERYTMRRGSPCFYIPALPQVVDLLSPEVLTEHVYAFRISQFNGMAEP